MEKEKMVVSTHLIEREEEQACTQYTTAVDLSWLHCKELDQELIFYTKIMQSILWPTRREGEKKRTGCSWLLALGLSRLFVIDWIEQAFCDRLDRTEFLYH